MKLVIHIWSWFETYEAGYKHMKLVINIWSWFETYEAGYKQMLSYDSDALLG